MRTISLSDRWTDNRCYNPDSIYRNYNMSINYLLTTTDFSPPLLIE
jgi:hypothetical protein